MTLGPVAPAYKAPSGFLSEYTFDAAGQVYAGGNALNGIKIDVSGYTAPAPPRPTGIAGIGNQSTKPTNPFVNGGTISRLRVDNDGNVYAAGVNGPVSASSTAIGGGPRGSGPGAAFTHDANGVFVPGRNQNPGAEFKMTGVSLDPARTSRGSGGAIPDGNNVYLREDREGLYFAQVDTAKGTAAYAYTAYQQEQDALGGRLQRPKGNAIRKQGGNAGSGGSSDDISSPLSLLGD